jgi:predicted metal-binding transcription factor (methanogenesis marker protein 9)
LEVKAFDPFISSLEPQQQRELKRQLAERIFGQYSATDEDSKVVDEHALRAVTDAFGKVLSKLPK